MPMIKKLGFGWNLSILSLQICGGIPFYHYEKFKQVLLQSQHGQGTGCDEELHHIDKEKFTSKKTVYKNIVQQPIWVRNLLYWLRMTPHRLLKINFQENGLYKS